MKFYESHYEEYIESKDHYNIHPELKNALENTPTKISQMGNMIFYGPSGAGKYTQVLSLLKKYSSIDLKYDKKITIQTDKQTYTYHISDIHYEIDMSLLGCNSKILWHENFLQIIDIVSIKPEKVGFIVCKNFHSIHTELLEIFYSYIQEYSGCLNSQHNTNHNSLPENDKVNFPSIVIHFIIITENISFIPNNILNSCQVLNICKPEKEKYKNILENKGIHGMSLVPKTTSRFTESCISKAYSKTNLCSGLRPSDRHKALKVETPKGSPTRIEANLDFKSSTGEACNTLLAPQAALKSPSAESNENGDNHTVFNIVEPNEIMNMKELYSFPLIEMNEIPKDIFNTVCDNIIHEIINHTKIKFTNFRDVIYDILIYNLEPVECIWYILHFFIHNNYLETHNISVVLNQTYVFLKYYNNNYRPIYHLESILFYLITKIHAD
jgi:hypothetical protein